MCNLAIGLRLIWFSPKKIHNFSFSILLIKLPFIILIYIINVFMGSISNMNLYGTYINLLVSLILDIKLYERYMDVLVRLILDTRLYGIYMNVLWA